MIWGWLIQFVTIYNNHNKNYNKIGFIGTNSWQVGLQMGVFVYEIKNVSPIMKFPFETLYIKKKMEFQIRKTIQWVSFIKTRRRLVEVRVEMVDASVYIKNNVE